MMKILFLVLLSSGFSIAQETSPNCSRAPGVLQDPQRSMGQANLKNPIQHMFIIMQENHSFDQYLGKISQHGYGQDVDGLNNVQNLQLYHETKYCQSNISHSWNSDHEAFDNGKNDGFLNMGHTSFGYYEPEDLNYYYALASRFAIGDRYFSSTLAPTFPNRMFLYAATADGEITDSFNLRFLLKNRKTIFDLLSDAQVSWRYYFQDIPSIGLTPISLIKHKSHMALMSQLPADLKKGNFPEVVFLDHSLLFSNEEPPKNPQRGQRAVARRINAIIGSRYWKDSAIFFTYDEAGGFFDHVAPPKACIPDEVQPHLGPDDFVADYDRLGFRVPFVAISPYSKKHYVSHAVYDHTSILKFIENKFNLPSLTRRDANANDLLDFFDFENPEPETQLPIPSFDNAKNAICRAKKHTSN